MTGRGRLGSKDKVDIINVYTNDLGRVTQLSRKYGVSRQAIYALLRKAGIPRTERFRVSCSCCGLEIERPRCQIRNRKHLFCSTECYYAYLDAGNGRLYVASRQGQRIAREKVGRIFNLLPGHVIHHEDRNQLNNSLENLKVFANNGDHVRYHRGCETAPIWEGSAIPITVPSPRASLR